MRDDHCLKLGRAVAARCWADPETEHLDLEPALVEAFAKRAALYLETLSEVWYADSPGASRHYLERVAPLLEGQEVELLKGDEG